MGEYTITRLLGRGGMGVVFEATHRRMQRRVAIKFVSSSSNQSFHTEDQFLAEIRAVARLLHPRIVTAFDAGQFGQTAYLVMEYVDGFTLTELLSQRGPRSVDEALNLTAQAAEGLRYAHLNSIIHRDVKPSNLIITQSGELKILDLGLASFLQSAVPTTSHDQLRQQSEPICGTPEFMSPEQFEGRELDESADIYSLGCTLHFLLTGRPPYTGEPIPLLKQHCCAEIPALSTSKRPVSDEVQQLFETMIAKDRANRFSNMQSVIEAITEIVGLHDVKQRIPPGPSKAGVAGRRHVPASVPLESNSSRPKKSDSANCHSAAITLAVNVGARFISAALASEKRASIPLQFGSKKSLVFPAAFSVQDNKVVLGSRALRAIENGDPGVARAFDAVRGGQLLRIGATTHPSTMPLTMLFSRLRFDAETFAGAMGSAKVFGADGISDAQPRIESVIINVASCFGQTVRERLVAAATLDGIKNVRLLDRNIAAVLSQFTFSDLNSRPLLNQAAGYWLVISIDDIAMEVALFGVSNRRIHMLSVVSHPNSNQCRWNGRLRRHLGKQIERHRPTDSPGRSNHHSEARNSSDDLSAEELERRAAESLQLKNRIDAGLDLLAEQESCGIAFKSSGKRVKAVVTSITINVTCADLLVELGSAIAKVLSESGVDAEEIGCVLAIGGLPMTSVVANLLRNFGIEPGCTHVSSAELATSATKITQIDRLSTSLAPRLVPCLGHDIAWTSIADGDEAPSIEAANPNLLMPRLTSLPASVVQRIPMVKNQVGKITLLERPVARDSDWIPFDTVELNGISECETKATFEIDSEGKLSVRLDR
ncbi:serine/threonine protein kinase [Rubripirellula amarantea]|nr:serine/threonine-protein kinase [Rubripirellula amarantea]